MTFEVMEHWQVAVSLGPCQAWGGGARDALTGPSGSLVLGDSTWPMGGMWEVGSVAPLHSHLALDTCHRVTIAEPRYFLLDGACVTPVKQGTEEEPW